MTDINELATLLGPYWSTENTRRRLGYPSLRDIETSRLSGFLLGLETADRLFIYPVWQFEKEHQPDGETTVVRLALLPILRTLRTYDPWTVAVLIHTPAPELDGQTPLDWARAHKPPQALANLAQTVAREWSTGTTSNPPSR
jgi:hypothetical protein